MNKKLTLIALILITALLLLACKSDEGIEYYYSPGDPFVTNVLAGDGVMVKAVLVLGMSRDSTTALDEKIAVIRDSILRTIRSASLEDLQSEYAQDILSERMTQNLNEIFPPGEKDEGVPLFNRVYFTDLVVQ